MVLFRGKFVMNREHEYLNLKLIYITQISSLRSQKSGAVCALNVDFVISLTARFWSIVIQSFQRQNLDLDIIPFDLEILSEIV